MSYNPEIDKPRTIEQYNILIDYMTNKAKAAYVAAVAAAKAQAETDFDTGREALREKMIAELEGNLAAETVETPDGPQPLPEAEYKTAWNAGIKHIDLSLAQQREHAIEQAISSIPQPETRADFERMYACYYPKEEPAFMEPAPTPEQKLALERSQIDAETSAKILAGFDYEVNGETLHFSYDSFDQQNFADTANACLLKKSGAEGLPDAVIWNGYRANGELVRLSLSADEFLALYTAGALAHKSACMEAGGTKKAALAGA